MYSIYKITNNLNNKCYIGVTDNVKRRFRNHETRAFNPNSKEYNKSLYRAFRKYGIDNFTFEVIDNTESKDIVFELEIKYVKQFDSKDKGYNETIGGEEPPVVSRISIEGVKDIRTMVYNKEDVYSLYKEYKDKISKRAFFAICYGESWLNVLPEMIDEEIFNYHKKKNLDRAFDKLQKGAKKCTKPAKKLSIEDVKMIRKLKSEGISAYKIHKDYFPHIRSYNTIADILRGESWADV